MGTSTFLENNSYFYQLQLRWRQLLLPSKLKKIDQQDIPYAPDEIRLFLVVRNEELRLPYFFKYYFDLGIDRMFIIDNNSTDGTLDSLLKQKQTHVFQIKENYVYYWSWINFLLEKYGRNHWCLIVDADEIFIYPYRDILPLKQLCLFLNQYGYTALYCLLLDMYSNKPLAKTIYKKGEDPLLTTPFFDPDTHCRRKHNFRNCLAKQDYFFLGGMRKRVFGLTPCLTKFPLVKFNKKMFLSDYTQATHFIESATIADIQGALLHFKFFNDFIPRAQEESKREQHYKKAVEYKQYAKQVMVTPELNLSYPKSMKFINEKQLCALNILNTSKGLDDFVNSQIFSKSG